MKLISQGLPITPTALLSLATVAIGSGVLAEKA
jgi:hypothetical protein